MLTIKVWLEGIGLKKAPIDECPAWPPDLFALAGTLIRRSGAYLRVFEHRNPAGYAKDIETAAQQWRERLDEITADVVSPADLRDARTADILTGWERLIHAQELAISDINKDDALAEELIRLTLIADEASRGMGVTWDNETDEGPKHSKFLLMAAVVLLDNDNQSYCWDVPHEVLCVLGKQHTPVKGATFRSLSHHVALYHPNEIKAIWMLPKKTVEHSPPRQGLNLLLLPWPERVETQHFQEIAPGGRRADDSEPPGYFRYNPKETNDATASFERRLKMALETAREHAGPIDAIVLPELALTEPQYEVAEKIAFAERCILVCGVRQARTAQGQRDSNISVLQAAGAVRAAQPDPVADEELLRALRLYQAKHHRWYLDHDQIVTYQLAGALPPSRGVWEHIGIEHPRVLHFVTVNATTWAVLICEDLARQDPAADLIRAVGPNLLIALLMDGPQLSNRWPARYAAVLAEDPGTSVLTLTSLGMTQRSRPILGSGQRAPISRVIALWRDAVAGEIQIALDADHNACVLNLECQMKTEYCADGRSDHRQARFPVYAGYCSFQVEDQAP